MSDCTCYYVENPWTYYGIVEPGGAMEPDPECPKHFPAPSVFELTIVDSIHPGRPPLTMNEWRNCHWRQKTTAKTRIAFQIKQALQASPVPPTRRCKVVITQYAPDGRRRDADGLSAFRKDVLDSLVRCGVFPDDNYNNVVDGGNFIDIDRTNPRMVIRLEVLDAT